MTENKELLVKQLEEEIKAIQDRLDNYEQSYQERQRMKSDIMYLKQSLKELQDGYKKQ
jgi:tRNA/tmRNA/rRNA uracil-C5-methylase (TrmA/RlmC/RlmD family)